MTASLSLLLLLQAGAMGVEFHPPADWQPMEAPPVQAFAPRGLAQGEVVLLALWPAEPMGTGGFAGWFERKLARQGETVLQQSAIEDRSARGLQVLVVTQRVQLPQGPIVRVVYGIGSADRAAMAMLTSNQDHLITRFAAEAAGFFESLRFPATSPPAAPASSPGASAVAMPSAGWEGDRPRGLFYRLQTSGGRMETRTRLFLPPDRVIRVEPMGGSTFDLARCSGDTCGTYRLEGGGLTVRWDNGRTDRLAFVRSGDGFQLDGDAFQPARGLSRDEATGTWVNPGGAGTTLELRADGSFQWGAGSAATTLRGHYTIQGLSLTLAFSDGTTRRYTLFAAGRSRPLGLISMDGTVYSRR